MYANSSLIRLDLSHWVFDKGQVIAWNSLKSLKLDWIELDDDDIVNLLSGCPALETLKLSAFHGFHLLEITSLNVKRLTLAGYLKPCDGNEELLEIIAPHIQHLDISGDLGHLKCRLVNVSSLVSASLPFETTCITESRDEDEDADEEDMCRDYHQVSENLVLDYLQKLSRVTQLTIGSWFAKVVFMLEENEHEEVSLPELRCKCLTLEMHVTEYNLYGVASLLRASPLLETLNIHLGVKLTDFHCELELSYFDEVDNISLWNWISDIVFPNLKNVKIVGCTEKCPKEFWCEWGDKLFKLSKFLIKNAVALKKFVIVGKRRKCWKCKESCFSRYLSGIAKKLLDIPRSSKNVVITYEKYALHD
ncbi:F-box/LRR-repeat protein At3g03360-like [Lycium barbarum]|uniref:F-box/LRR-repeat protein At3g03360-like n=1 Tax=Lycium barbarum TaxID=112863 RepID=UPI00293E0E66|nr:F-box/LRR-repeat protein At3g03360-like [Lycium barbarum]